MTSFFRCTAAEVGRRYEGLLRPTSAGEPPSNRTPLAFWRAGASDASDAGATGPRFEESRLAVALAAAALSASLLSRRSWLRARSSSADGNETAGVSLLIQVRT